MTDRGWTIRSDVVVNVQEVPLTGADSILLPAGIRQDCPRVLFVEKAITVEAGKRTRKLGSARWPRVCDSIGKSTDNLCCDRLEL